MNKGMVILACFLAGIADADTLLIKSDRLSAFNDFLSSASVSLRNGAKLVEFSSYHYELRQGTKLENGCRFQQILSQNKGQQRVEHVIAQDMNACKRLFLIGNLDAPIGNNPGPAMHESFGKPQSDLTPSAQYEDN